MSNFLLKNPDCVFIHIPKTGGSTIRLGLWDRRYDGPFFEMKPEWLDTFKFAFVRHPIERVESAYRDFVQNRRQQMSPQWFAKIVLDERIDFRAPTEGDVARKIRHHTIPMTHPYNCLEYADCVGRFETFEEDVKLILEYLDFPVPDTLPRIRATKGHERIFKGATLQALVEYYQDDFKEFRYEF